MSIRSALIYSMIAAALALCITYISQHGSIAGFNDGYSFLVELLRDSTRKALQNCNTFRYILAVFLVI